MSTSKRRGNNEGSNPALRKDGRWQIHIRWTDKDGRPQRETVYGKTAEEARDSAAEVRRRIQEGMPARDQRSTVGMFALEWIDSTLEMSDRKSTTKSLYASLARNHIIGSSIGNMTFHRLKPMHVEQWIVELRKKGLADSSLRSLYAVIRSVLDAAVTNELVGRNVAAAVARPRIRDRKEALHLKPTEIARLMASAEKTSYAPLFELLSHTGLRRGEALALRWANVDHEAGIIRVRGTLTRKDGKLVVTTTKTAKSKRELAMTPSVDRLLRRIRLEQLQARMAAGSMWVETGFVFVSSFGEPRDPRNALRALKVTAARANLSPAIGLHSLRHSAATTMLDSGVVLKTVSEVLGHSSISITADVYGHVSAEVARDAMAALSNALGATP